LNQVHLRIHHALKETSYLTDPDSMTGSGGMATTIGNYLFDPMSHRAHAGEAGKE